MAAVPRQFSSTAARPGDALSGMIGGDLLSQAIGVVTCLGVPEELAGGTRSVVALAEAVGADDRALQRFMRYLAACQIFEDVDEGRYGLNDVSTLLRDEGDGSLAGWAKLRHELAGPMAGAMLHSIRTGDCAFAHLHKASFYEYLAGHPELEIPWNAAMVSRAQRVGAVLNELVNWTDVGTVVDVGGHCGAVLNVVLRGRAIAGVILDQPHVVGAAGTESQDGVGDRISVVGGDFFVSVPTGGDLYALANVICDWPDDQALTVLSNCRAAMSPSARLVICEPVLPNGRGFHPAKMTDLVQFTLLGGKIRDLVSWNALLHASGLRLANLRSAGPEWSVIEATVR